MSNSWLHLHRSQARKQSEGVSSLNCARRLLWSKQATLVVAVITQLPAVLAMIYFRVLSTQAWQWMQGSSFTAMQLWCLAVSINIYGHKDKLGLRLTRLALFIPLWILPATLPAYPLV